MARAAMKLEIVKACDPAITRLSFSVPSGACAPVSGQTQYSPVKGVDFSVSGQSFQSVTCPFFKALSPVSPTYCFSFDGAEFIPLFRNTPRAAVSHSEVKRRCLLPA